MGNKAVDFFINYSSSDESWATWITETQVALEYAYRYGYE